MRIFAVASLTPGIVGGLGPASDVRVFFDEAAARAFGNDAGRPVMIVETEDECDEIIRKVLTNAWHIAKDGCLLPPDGGSPTEGEVAVSQRIANHIREMMPDSKLPVLGER